MAKKKRSVEPVEVQPSDKKMLSDLQRHAKRLTGRTIGRGPIFLRAFRIAGPMMLKGEVPLMEPIVIDDGQNR